MTRVTDVRGDLNLKALVGCSSHHFRGPGHIVSAPLQAVGL